MKAGDKVRFIINQAFGGDIFLQVGTIVEVDEYFTDKDLLEKHYIKHIKPTMSWWTLPVPMFHFYYEKKSLYAFPEDVELVVEDDGSHKCICDSLTVFNAGCKCGGC